MSLPFSASELRDLIQKLERLEVWQAEVERSNQASSSAKGYSRGDPKARASAAGSAVSLPAFPAISQIARLWTCTKDAGPAFIGEGWRTVPEGPGPVPPLVEDQAAFVCHDEREGLQRVHLSYSAGFWARVSLETYTDQVSPAVISEPAKHFIVLRACGLGGAVRFASAEHFDHFRNQIFSGGCVFHGFATETELEVFCQGARIAVPALYQPWS